MDSKKPNSLEPQEVDLTPDLEEEDRSFLNIILGEYNEELIPRLGIELFKTRYLPALAAEDGESTHRAALRMWEAEVAKNNRLPVYIVDENNEVKYKVPPIITTIPTRKTGTTDAMHARFQNYTMQMGRLYAQGQIAQKAMYNNIPVHSRDTLDWGHEWYRILNDFGYLGTSVVQTTTQSTFVPPEFDDDEDMFVQD